LEHQAKEKKDFRKKSMEIKTQLELDKDKIHNLESQLKKKDQELIQAKKLQRQVKEEETQLELDKNKIRNLESQLKKKDQELVQAKKLEHQAKEKKDFRKKSMEIKTQLELDKDKIHNLESQLRKKDQELTKAKKMQEKVNKRNKVLESKIKGIIVERKKDQDLSQAKEIHEETKTNINVKVNSKIQPLLTEEKNLSKSVQKLPLTTSTTIIETSDFEFDQQFESFLEKQNMPEQTRPTMRGLSKSKKIQIMNLQDPFFMEFEAFMTELKIPENARPQMRMMDNGSKRMMMNLHIQKVAQESKRKLKKNPTRSKRDIQRDRRA